MDLPTLTRLLREAVLDKRLPYFSVAQVRAIGNRLGVNWSQVSISEFQKGLHVEMEHGSINPKTNVTSDDMTKVGKIALIHLLQIPDYYTKLYRFVLGRV